MVRATMRIKLPERVWVAEVSTVFPEVTFDVYAAIPGEHTGFAIVGLRGDDLDGVIDAMGGHTQIVESTVLDRRENAATVHFETSAPLLLLTSQAAGVPIEHPVSIVDGEATLDVTCSYERLAGFVEQLDRHGFTFTIKYMGDRTPESELLTDHQLDVLMTALDLGYYDSPRRITLTELADELGIAKSTCSECLHRAEGAIIEHFASQLPPYREVAAGRPVP